MDEIIIYAKVVKNIINYNSKKQSQKVECNMKQVIALRYYQSNASCDMLFNTAVHYVLRYTEYENQMLFFIREEIADERTAYFLGDLLCHIFGTTYSNNRYSYPKGNPDYEVGIYDMGNSFIVFFEKQPNITIKDNKKSYKNQKGSI